MLVSINEISLRAHLDDTYCCRGRGCGRAESAVLKSSAAIVGSFGVKNELEDHAWRVYGMPQPRQRSKCVPKLRHCATTNQTSPK